MEAVGRANDRANWTTALSPCLAEPTERCIHKLPGTAEVILPDRTGKCFWGRKESKAHTC